MSRGHDDYQSEPIRGLPERLPPGEHILWQGAPGWWQLAKDVFHFRTVAVYFAALMLWRGFYRFGDAGGDYRAVMAAVLSLLPVAMAGLALLSLLAWLSSRTTVYTITNRRLVLRIGVALPTAINIPFRLVGAVGFRPRAGGAGDLSLTLLGDERMAFSTLWPHVRPWRINHPQPMLRAIPDAARVASLLSAALNAEIPASAIRAPVQGGPAVLKFPTPQKTGVPASASLRASS